MTSRSKKAESYDPAVTEFQRRRDLERAKCVKKYGDDALVPTGHPDKDVLDYFINEMVGMVRYAEMLEARCSMMHKMLRPAPRRQRELFKQGVALGRELTGVASRASFDLIRLWQGLREQKLPLGEREKA